MEVVSEIKAKMCPMRLFLVIFSAILACYLAWRNYSKNEKELSLLASESEGQSEDSTMVADSIAPSRQIYSNVSSYFWTVVDMASGRYLWKGLKLVGASTESKQR